MSVNRDRNLPYCQYLDIRDQRTGVERVRLRVHSRAGDSELHRGSFLHSVRGRDEQIEEGGWDREQGKQ